MRTVLIVDDELAKPANAELFRREYAIEGVKYRFAGTAEEMFELLAEDESVACIFLDIRFEGQDHEHGLAILKRLADEGWPLPVVMMSSLSDSETIIKSWDLGAQGYVRKWAVNPRFFENCATRYKDTPMIPNRA